MANDLRRLILQDWPISREELWNDLQLLMRLKVNMQGWPTTEAELDSQLSELLHRNEIAIKQDLISPVFQSSITTPTKLSQQSLFLES